MTVIIVLLIVMLAGIAYLVRAYGIQATDPGQPGYQSVLSMLLAAVAGRGVFYYISIGAILAVLTLSANTAFADFPRLCRAIAQNNYLPHSFATRGRRLVYTQGIVVLAVLAGIAAHPFRRRHRPPDPAFRDRRVSRLYTFTSRHGGPLETGGRPRVATRSMLVNGLGAVATGITVVVVLVAKFAAGAWVTVLMIPTLLVAMGMVRRHYHSVFLEVRTTDPLDLKSLTPPMVIVPIQGWNQITKKALRFAFNLSPDVYALHVDSGEGSTILRDEWSRYVEGPAKEGGVKAPQLIVLPSPYRLVLAPIVDYVLEAERTRPNQQIAVLIPELVERHWYHYVLHNKRASILKTLLLLKGNQRIVVIDVPWYLET